MLGFKSTVIAGSMACVMLNHRPVFFNLFEVKEPYKNYWVFGVYMAEPRYSKKCLFEDSQGTQLIIGGTSEFRGTQVEKHCHRP